jgi:hypothetical protein
VYRIQKIKLTTGPELEPGNLTVAIGPNNGGKSQFLKDLVAAISTPHNPRKSVEGITPLLKKGALHVVRKIISGAQQDPSGNLILDRVNPDLGQPQQVRASREILRLKENDDELYATQVLRETLGSHLVCHLTTERRLLLVNRQVNKNNNVVGVQSVLEAAYEASEDDAAMIAATVKAAFDTNLVLGDTKFSELEYRVGKAVPQNADRHERDKELAQLAKLDDQGDGLRSFCGIVAAIALIKRPIITIDEPEAFLHPPQAYLIGRAIGELSGRGVQFFVATHSADVLRGILSIVGDATIVRFSEEDDIFSSHVMDPGKLREITSDPMLSSARVLDGLFYTGVAITEADGDAILYRSVLETIDQSASIGFVNSYSKQLSGRIAKVFHSARVPCAVLVDFDMLRVRDEFRKIFEGLGGTWADIDGDFRDFTAAIEGVETAESRLSAVLHMLEEVKKEMKPDMDAVSQIRLLRRRLSEVRDRASLWHALKKHGRNALPKPARQPYLEINEQCRRVGLFITTEGDREAWLVPDVPFIKNNKAHWTELALTHLYNRTLSEDHPLMKYVRDFRTYCLGLKPSSDPALNG